MLLGDFQEGSAVLGTATPWMRSGRDDRTLDAAMRAGAVLSLVDQRVRASLPWRRAWLDRLALEAAAGTSGLINRPETTQQIRDAHHLCRPGDDPGQGARLYALWRHFAAHRPSLNHQDLVRACSRLGVEWTNEFEVLRMAAVETRDSSPLIAAISFLEGAAVQKLESLPVLILLADTLVAKRAGWSLGVPVLARAAGPLTRPKTTPDDRRRALISFNLTALTALELSHELAERAEVLRSISGRLRAKGAPGVLKLLLERDAIGSGMAIEGFTDRGLRRLFDRLLAFGAIRELTGRTSFRLYGL